MKDEIKKQIRLSVIFIVLICLFTGLGLYFRGNPLFSGQGLRVGSNAEKPVSTYEPYVTAAAPGAVSGQTSIIEAEAVAVPRFYTTARQAVFTFSGLGSEQELQGVLEALKNTNSRATFFVTAEELETRGEQIEEICRAGHSLGIAVLPEDGATARSLLESMQTEAETLRSRYQAYYEIFVRPSSGYGSTALLQAAAAGNFRVLKELKEAVPERVSRMTDAQAVMGEVFNENEGMLQRGEIVHFQMGLFQYSETVLGELVEKVASEKSCYPICSADELAEDTRSLYTYPVAAENVLPEVKDQIHPGHLEGKTDKEIFGIIRKGYLGIDWVTSPFFLPGFTEAEVSRLDQRGIIKNDENYVFLTFDDWGTDGTVDKLLNVLEKHDATATFFVRTANVPSNPNLLRSIAAAGHTVGAHTHMHMPISNELSATHFAELSEEQRRDLELDLVLCYDTMQSVIGDMRDADGKPSLSLLFRPPTLAVGKNGLTTVFDCGYTHAISGNYTSTDYKADSAAKLASELKKHIVSGSVIVLHFSDNAQYTAEAIDMLLTDYENSGSSFRFVGLNKVY